MAAAEQHMLVTQTWSVPLGFNGEYMCIERGEVLRVDKQDGPWLFVKNLTGSPDWDRCISLPSDCLGWISGCCGWVPISVCSSYPREVPNQAQQQEVRNLDSA